MALGEIQSSLNAGELSPSMYARVDIAKFESGAALLRNFFVDFRGGVNNRAGTQFVAATKAVAGAKRLLPFTVSTQAAYVLEFGNLYVRIYLNQAFVAEITTPYLSTDLAGLKYTQSADVLTLVHPSYPPANLSRLTTTTFSYALIAVGPTIQPPTITTMTAPHSGPYSFGYLVCAVDLDGKEESLPSNPGVKHSLAMDERNNQVIGLTWTAPAQGVSRYNIYKWGPIDSVTLNPATVWGFIGTSQTTTFTDDNIAPDFSKQPPGWGDPFSGGQFQSITVASGGSGYDGVSGDWPTAVPYVALTITGDGTGAAGYAVVDHALGTIIGVFLTNPGMNYTHATMTANGQGGTGATFNVTFSDIQPLYPSCTAYIQQRRAFAGSNAKPETLVLSQVGLYNNFNTTPVSLSTDAIPLSIAGEQVNTIKSMVPVSYGLILFTTGGVNLLNGGSPYAPISPATVSTQSQSSVGANDLIPIRISTDIIYGQNKGNRIRNLSYAWQRQSYQGSDISAIAAHLFDGFMTNEWAWAEEPFKVVWAVRDDGRLLSLTYAPDQEVAAWCRHDTQGLFESVCSIPEGNVDAVYFIVNRYIPANNSNPSDPTGNWVQYIERMADRLGCCIFDAWFLDCALSLPTPSQSQTLFLSGTTGNVNLTTTTSATGPRFPDFTQIRNFDSSGVGALDPQECSPDWDNQLLFVYSGVGGKIMSFNLTTAAVVLAPTVTTAFGSGLTVGEDHNVYGIKGATNCGTISKVNPTTGATISSFGVSSSGFSTSATTLAFPWEFDTVQSAGVTYYVGTSLVAGVREITVVNLNTMSWCGLNFTSDQNRGAVTKGLPVGAPAVSGGTPQAFVVCCNAPTLQLSLYQVLVGTPPTYNLVAHISAFAIDPTWTHVTNVLGLVLDQTDGNILAHCENDVLTNYAGATTYALGDLVQSAGFDYVSLAGANTGHTPVSSPTFWRNLGASLTGTHVKIAKINITNGGILWATTITATLPGAQGRTCDSVVSKGTYTFGDLGPSTVHQINTATGVDNPVALVGVSFGYQFCNDALGEFIPGASYINGAGTPVPFGGGASSFSGEFCQFGPAPAAPQIGSFTTPGQVIQIGCGKILLNTVTNTFTATGTVVDALDITIPDDPNGTPLFIEPGDWTLTTPVSTLSGLAHLNGKQVTALADGVVVNNLTVTGGTVTIPTPATNIVVGLSYTQQIQTLYLTMDDLQPGSIQGKRKLVPAATLRLDCTKGLKIGQDFNNLTLVPDLGDIDTNFVGLAPGTLFSGDAYSVFGGAWDEKGEVCIQQDDPLPASVLGIIVQVVPGDTGR